MAREGKSVELPSNEKVNRVPKCIFYLVPERANQILSSEPGSMAAVSSLPLEWITLT